MAVFSIEIIASYRNTNFNGKLKLASRKLPGINYGIRFSNIEQ